MALNWSTEKVKYFNDNPDELWVKYREGEVEEYSDVNAETKSLIFGTMGVGIGYIDYKNAPSFYARWKLMEKLDGLYLYSTWMNGESEKIYLTPDVLVKHFGLSTNVGKVSDKDWLDKYHKNYTLENARGKRTAAYSYADMRNMIKEAKEEFENYFIGIATEGK